MSGIERGHRLRQLLDHGDLEAAQHEGLDHLEADVPTADHDRTPWRAGAEDLVDGQRVGDRLDAEHAGCVEVRERRPDRRGADGDQHLVVPLVGLGARVEVSHGDGSSPGVDRDHLVARPDVDPVGAVLFGAAGHQPVGRPHEPAHEVGQAARRERRVLASLEDDDLPRLGTPADLRRCRHAGGVAADDHHSFHDRSSSDSPLVRRGRTADGSVPGTVSRATRGARLRATARR
jgi:hypothetical protein